MATANYYRMLALQHDATDIDIKRRYRQLSFKHHPDHGGDAEKMMLINEAYGVLSNTTLRREYDIRHALERVSANSHPRSYYSQPSVEYVRPRQSEQRSQYWIWLCVFGMVLFIFFAYLLHGLIQPAANTGIDRPISESASLSRSETRQSRSFYQDEN